MYNIHVLSNDSHDTNLLFHKTPLDLSGQLTMVLFLLVTSLLSKRTRLMMYKNLAPHNDIWKCTVCARTPWNYSCLFLCYICACVSLLNFDRIDRLALSRSEDKSMWNFIVSSVTSERYNNICMQLIMRGEIFDRRLYHFIRIIK